MDSRWSRRRWHDFRLGHSTYLIFILTFSNFILISHRLLIERVPVLEQLFSDLWIFALVFVLAYIPVAVLVGVWHRRTQFKIDLEQQMRQNLFLVKTFRTIIDIQTGKASKEETESFRNFLYNIEKGKTK